MVEIPLNLQEDKISVEWNTEKLIWVITHRTSRCLQFKIKVPFEAAYIVYGKSLLEDEILRVSNKS